MELYETEKWKKMIAAAEENLRKHGGGSNMAEPPYVPPGPIRIPDGLPPEEVARRKKASAEIDEIFESLKHEKRS